MINSLPVIGWMLSFGANASMSVPFWLIWTAFGIGRRYFYWLPEIYQSIPFWNCVGLFIVIGILKTVLTPRLVSVSQSNKEKP